MYMFMNIYMMYMNMRISMSMNMNLTIVQMRLNVFKLYKLIASAALSNKQLKARESILL